MRRYELTDEQWDLIEYLFPEREDPNGRSRGGFGSKVTWSLTVTELPSRSTSARAKHTSRRSSKPR